jgi:hypothetical protein
MVADTPVPARVNDKPSWNGTGGLYVSEVYRWYASPAAPPWLFVDRLRRTAALPIVWWSVIATVTTFEPLTVCRNTTLWSNTPVLLVVVLIMPLLDPFSVAVRV